MIGLTQMVVMLVDSSKFDRAGLGRICDAYKIESFRLLKQVLENVDYKKNEL